jgi:DNA-binding protein HU-beta
MSTTYYIEEFTRQLAAKNKHSQNYYRDALRDILKGIKSEVARGNEVKFMGFGRFYTRKHKGGTGLNFKTGQKVDYKPSKTIGFSASRTLRKTGKK